jgi:hypothetical protein
MKSLEPPKCSAAAIERSIFGDQSSGVRSAFFEAETSDKFCEKPFSDLMESSINVVINTDDVRHQAYIALMTKGSRNVR